MPTHNQKNKIPAGEKCILGLGCNICDRLANLRQALNHLQDIAELNILQVSPIYESDALLTEDAPNIWKSSYLNCTISCCTTLTPEELLKKTKVIETRMGREPKEKWAPRVIDIDILAWEDNFFITETLQIPHSQLTERPFAMWPLADLWPNWKYCCPNTLNTGKTATEITKAWGSRFNGLAPLHTKQINHRIDTPQIMGILNITPDSFSDGNTYNDPQQAINHAKLLFDGGANIIDVGAESTRPHAHLLSSAEEWERLQPVLEALQSAWPKNTFRPKISIDTKNPATAKLALKFAPDFINDVTGFTSPQMCELANLCTAKLIAMHNLGVPPSSNLILSHDKSASDQIYAWASHQLQKLTTKGIAAERLIFDVGIGFGKSAEQSWEIIHNIDKFKSLPVPILVGHSRKSFLSKFTDKPALERDIETTAISSFLATKNVAYLRVHNVAMTMRFLKISCMLKNNYQ